MQKGQLSVPSFSSVKNNRIWEWYYNEKDKNANSNRSYDSRNNIICLCTSE